MRIHIVTTLSFVLVVGLCTAIHAQDVESTTEVLKRLASGRIIEPYNENIEYLQNEVKGLPLLDGMELRTETEHWDVDQQQLSLRMSFNSRDEQKAVSGIFASMEEMYLIKQQEYLADEVATTYQDLIDLYFATSESDVILEEIALARDRVQYVRNLMEITQQAKLEDWLDVQEDLIDIMNDSVQIGQKISMLKAKLKVIGDVSFVDMITIDHIREQALSNLADTETLETKMAAVEEDKARYEYQLEEAESNKWLDFLQVQYQSDDRISFQDEVSFGASISLPTSSRNRVKRQEAALEFYEKKYERIVAGRSAKQEKTERYNDVIRSIEMHNSLVLDIGGLQLDAIYERYLQMDGVSPDELLKIRQTMVALERKKLDARSEIYQEYLQLIEIRGGVDGASKINLLSNNLEKY